jgi:hypothetical protein
MASFGEYVADGVPETKRSVSYGQLRCSHPALFEISQELCPRLRRLSVAVLDGHELLLTVEPSADHDQSAQPIVLPEPHARVDGVHPDADVAPAREIALHEALSLGLPAFAEAGDGRRREPRLGAEELFEGGHEVPAGEPVQIRQRQNLRHFRLATHVGWHDHALESFAVAVFV